MAKNIYDYGENTKHWFNMCSNFCHQNPPSKRILLDNFRDRLKLINVFFVSISIFILIYNFFPIIKFQDPFIKGFFIALKLLTALSGMMIVFTFSKR